jgi:hypothetical protein
MTTKSNTARKIGITIPRQVLRAIDSAARRRGRSRSGFIVEVLEVATSRARDVEITRRLDEIFGNEKLRAEQLRTAEEFLVAGRWDEWES